MTRLDWKKQAWFSFLLCAATAIALPAQTFNTLFTFNGTNGSDPFAPLVQATDGYLYGTTSSGGRSNACTSGCGTIFKVAPSGKLTTLYDFCVQSGCADGQYPDAGLLQAPDGSFYGATVAGGANEWGTIFSMTPSGALTVLYTECSKSGCADGADPSAALVRDADGSFYGTTVFGGTSDACPDGVDGCGTVFEMTPSGSLTTLYSFCSKSNCADGDTPYYVGLVHGTDGNFYGTTLYGGANSDSLCHGLGTSGCGTVFKITPSGTLTTLYRFCSQSGSDCPDGADPIMGLVQGLDGNLYGTTYEGGAHGAGTVFKITPTGVLTTIYNFCSQSDCTDGYGSFAPLIQATDGNFYGTTGNGGVNGGGTVFRVTPSGVLSTLYNFCSQTDCTDGQSPSNALLQDTSGTIYGATQNGGSTSGTCTVFGCGTLFSLSVGLGPFVKTQPTSGKVGAVVKILGTDLSGATSVTFDGTAATFTVESRSAIRTTVPAGATTGIVQVVTPGGTLSSNVPFRVLP